MKLRSFTSAALVAISGALLCAASASARLELKVSSKYVVYPGAVTVKVRTTDTQAIEFRQERLDRRSVAPGGSGPGWSCTSPGLVSKPGYLEGPVVARIANPVPNKWISLRLPATRLAFTRPLTQGEIVAALIPQPKELTAGSCLDPFTQYTRLQAYQPGADLVGVSLTRFL